ncbi:MAG: dTDP-4-dehydrorhamnose 3,5-epimerase [Chloroflexota bacterium]
MIVTPTSIPEVLLIQLKAHGDERGFFMETYQARTFEKIGLPSCFVQDNHTRSIEGTLRGLHFQIRNVQGKLVRVVSGEIFDVAVDLRASSPTFGKWVGTYISGEGKTQIWIPPGFAHGFYVLSNWADVIYKVTDFYSPKWERTLLWNDPHVRVEWPIPSGKEPILSEKDKKGKRLQDIEVFTEYLRGKE